MGYTREIEKIKEVDGRRKGERVMIGEDFNAKIGE